MRAIPLIKSLRMRNSFYAAYGKRAFDVLSAFCGVVLVSPILILGAAAVKLSGPGPVLFKHKRVGMGGTPFFVYKFRTMRAGADKTGASITVGGDSRVTAVGKLLRKTKIDELPQLFNVLKGEMSLVGPRPEVPQYVELFRDDYSKVLLVRPGITDFAAIEYANEEEVLAKYPDPHVAYKSEVLPAKIRLYQKYIDQISFGTDLAIIFRTFARIAGSN